MKEKCQIKVFLKDSSLFFFNYLKQKLSFGTPYSKNVIKYLSGTTTKKSVEIIRKRS